MKISILLPYKENFSPDYPGAVSLFVYETSKKSAFKKNIFGAPTFVVNNQIFWGQDRLDYALDEYDS